MYLTLLKWLQVRFSITIIILFLGSFGLNFDGVFSQPARFIDGKWVPATDYSKPRDPEMKLPYMVQMSKLVMSMKPDDLPPVVPYFPCICKTKAIKKKHVLH